MDSVSSLATARNANTLTGLCIWKDAGFRCKVDGCKKIYSCPRRVKEHIRVKHPTEIKSKKLSELFESRVSYSQIYKGENKCPLFEVLYDDVPDDNNNINAASGAPDNILQVAVAAAQTVAAPEAAAQADKKKCKQQQRKQQQHKQQHRTQTKICKHHQRKQKKQRKH
jgi:hypothetical protein